jgi:hypothetical protein
MPRVIVPRYMFISFSDVIYYLTPLFILPVFSLSFSSEIIENRKLFLLEMFLLVDSSMEWISLLSAVLMLVLQIVDWESMQINT